MRVGGIFGGMVTDRKSPLYWVKVRPKRVARNFPASCFFDRENLLGRYAPVPVEPLPHHPRRYADSTGKFGLRDVGVSQISLDIHLAIYSLAISHGQ